MRKISQMILTLLFAIPMLFGGLSTLGVFSNGSNSASNGLNTLLATSNGGGGADSLKGDDNGDLPHPNTEETTTYTFKTYDDYFVDNDLPTDISQTTITGNGSSANPYIINSTEDFYFLSNVSLNSKYIELATDIYLNDETFDKDGNPSGGDGVVYSWRLRGTWYLCNWDGKGYSVSGMYFNDVTKTGVALFGCPIKFKNLTIKNVFLQAKGEVAPLQYGTSSHVELDNIKTYGTIKAEYNAYGIINDAQKIINCENHINIIQIDLGLTKRSFFAGIAINASVVDDCKNYGNIDVFYSTYVGGIVSSGVCHNSKNYGNITIVSHSSGNITGVGGILGIVNGNKEPLKNCKNYGTLTKNGACTFSGAILGYLYESARIEDCINYGELNGFAAFVGGDTPNCKETSEIVGCKNYGTVTGYNVFIRNIDSNINFIDCHNYGDVNVIDGRNGACFNTLQDNCQIINCSFDCTISGSKYNSSYFNIFGFVYGADRNLIINNFRADVTFYDTGGYFTSLGYVVGGSSQKQNIEIKNSKFDYDIKDSRLNNLYILAQIQKCGSVSIENVEIINRNISNVSMKLLAKLYGKLNIKNLIIRDCISKQVAFGEFALQFYEGYTLNLNGFVRQMYTENEMLGQFYGSNFSGFYVSWRTGKVDLVALDGRGSFQGKVDEDWLLNKGYEKKTI